MDSSRFVDPGGTSSRSYPPLNTYTHHAKRLRFDETKDASAQNSLYLTFKVSHAAKTLKSFSPFKINDALNKISNEWKFISANRERDVITILVTDENISQKFIKTNSIQFDQCFF